MAFFKIYADRKAQIVILPSESPVIFNQPVFVFFISLTIVTSTLIKNQLTWKMQLTGLKFRQKILQGQRISYELHLFNFL